MTGVCSPSHPPFPYIPFLVHRIFYLLVIIVYACTRYTSCFLDLRGWVYSRTMYPHLMCHSKMLPYDVMLLTKLHLYTYVVL